MSENTFQFVKMVRVYYSFQNVDEKKRRQLLAIVLDMNIERFSGGSGGGNYGIMYIPESEVESLRQRLVEAGLAEIIEAGDGT